MGEYVFRGERDLREGGCGEEVFGGGVVVEVCAGEGCGEGGDVEAVEVQGGGKWGEEGVKVQGDAAGAGAEVEDVEGFGEGGGGEEEGGEVGGYGFGFGSVVHMRKSVATGC